MVSICLNDFFYAVSYALDSVEAELLGVTSYHGKRTAYLASQLGRALGQADQPLLYLGCAAVLHDNALTEYIRAEQTGALTGGILANLGAHCLMGEHNVQQLPFYREIRSAVLFHHEQADGGGPFHKTTDETCLFARLIHFSDALDAVFHLDSVSAAQYETICTYVKEHTGTLFDPQITQAFFRVFDLPHMQKMAGQNIEPLLRESLPVVFVDYSAQALSGLADIFARIIDYKSASTTAHSLGMAEKSEQIGRFYGWDSDLCAKYRLAGALHDVGKLAIPSFILEKPGKLTAEEYETIQRHVRITGEILGSVHGLEDVASWAANHHEKLDGTGYPFGKTADQLGTKERIMACLDIYQVLTEARPYKPGMPHEDAMKLLRSMSKAGQLDAVLVEDVNACFGPVPAGVR